MVTVLSIKSTTKQEFIDITALLRKEAAKQNISSGVVFLFCPHTTAALTINENADPAVKKDIITALRKLVPAGQGIYQHLEGNSDAHIKAALIGSSVNILIEKNNLVLGRWQGVYFCEFDGPRQREVWLKFLPCE